MHTENQLPSLPGSALKVPGGGGVGWVASYPFLSQAPTPAEVELGCANNAVNSGHFVSVTAHATTRTNCFVKLQLKAQIPQLKA